MLPLKITLKMPLYEGMQIQSLRKEGRTAFLFVLYPFWKCEGTVSKLNCLVPKKANNHQLLLKHLILINSSLTLS